ncbi:hypothetical protein CRYUN_Cryun38cG0050400 [Craigia yunnanensis]
MANSSDQTTSLSSERQETSLKACGSCCDKISNLPDALIHRILSFLPTKQAVATSVLSKRWVCLWTLVPTLDLEESDYCRIDEQAKMKFVHFVYRVLLLNKAGSVEKFRLNCNPVYGHSCINTWICSAIERGFQKVDISVSETAKKDLVKLPSGLFLVKTLKNLKLHGGIMVDVPGSVCFASLKILHLLCVHYANVDSVRWLIFGCLNLEELRIDASISHESMVNINISTTTLNSLSLTLYHDRRPKPHEKNFEINAPSLKYLNASCPGFDPHQIFVENFPCLIEANISVLDYYRIQLFRALNGAKCLKLHGLLSFLAQERNSFPLLI